MKLTRFRNLRLAIESLDPNLMRKKLQHLSDLLLGPGIPISAGNTAITHDGIFYIDPESGIAAKVIAYNCETNAIVPSVYKRKQLTQGYTDSNIVQNLNAFHLMRCNTLAEAERQGWKGNYRLTKRLEGTFFLRIIEQDLAGQSTGRVLQEIQNQKLPVCQNCYWKLSSLLVDAQKIRPEDVTPKLFFDVNQIQSWNSLGKLSKDHGFTKDMYPKDWQTICQIRRAQVQYQCERCYIDLSEPKLHRYLYVYPIDHIEREEGFVKLECLCLSCLSQVPGQEHLRDRQEWEEFNEDCHLAKSL